MSDYIRRDDAIRRLRILAHEWVEEDVVKLGLACEPIDTIRAIPSADVVKVTRCKDCEYINYLGSGTMGEIECSLLQILVSRCSFCSFGRRKDD